jgi:hypothetical protein
VERNPYSPPSAPVADRGAQAPPKWGRAAWLYLPIFAGLAVLLIQGREAYLPSVNALNVAVALALSGLLLYQPVRHLMALSEQPPPWYWDALYYATVVLFVSALAVDNAWLMIATGLPTVLMNGALGVASLIVEATKPVRVYISGRRFVFVPRHPREIEQ